MKKSLILDMDGVLWLEDQAIGDLPRIFEKINSNGFKVILATNNATRSVAQYLKKLSGFGVHLEKWQVINSSEATAIYLRELYPDGGGVYVVGEDALIQTMEAYGFFHTNQNPVAVITALDRTISYNKIKEASLLIQHGAKFITTNPDCTYPSPQGLIPGAGAITAAVEAATGVKPVVIGKPSPGMYKAALSRLGSLPSETLVVGDRLETDIAGGQALGCATALVLSGVTAKSAALEWSPPPDMIAANLDEVIDELITL